MAEDELHREPEYLELSPEAWARIRAKMVELLRRKSILPKPVYDDEYFEAMRPENWR